MVTGTLELELFLPGSRSLKDKRRLLKSLQDRVRSRYNVSIAEIGYQDKWQRARIGVAVVNNQRVEAERTLQRVRDIFRENAEFYVNNEIADFIITDLEP